VRLLVAVDSLRVRRRFSDLLRDLGHTVTTAESLEDALERLGSRPVDLLFAEFKTPEKDAMKQVEAVRRRRPDLRVVPIVASTDLGSAVADVRLGPLGYVRRPIRAERVRQLLDRVEHEFESPPGTQGRTGAVGGVASISEPSPPDLLAPVSQDLGEGRLEPGSAEARAREGRIQKVLRIDATTAPPNLLGRLLVGSYITGQDQVLVTAAHGLTTAQRREVHRMADRILGMTVVGDSTNLVEVQNFVDPGKYELPRLLNRVVHMLQSQLTACRTALSGPESGSLQQIKTTEEEIDRFYLLMVRQLLLSSDSPQIARSVDVGSHHFQLGYRLVAKVLEVTGDLIDGIGSELEGNLPGLRRLPRPMSKKLIEQLERLELLFTRTMDAFTSLSAVEANATLNTIGEALPKASGFGDVLARRVPNRRVAIAAQRIVSNLVMALEMLVIVNEVTINRSVEPETVTRSGTRGPIGPHGSAPPPNPTPGPE
jgi:CheY-like chemotaxis protein